MRICNSCNKELEDSLFDYRGGARKGLQATCKPCSLLRLKQHRQRIRKLVNRWKELKGCSVCGFKGHHFQLDLDHIDKTTKNNKDNSRAYEPSWKLERVKEELAKCQILCANCHRLKTWKEKDHLTIVCDSPAHDDANYE